MMFSHALKLFLGTELLFSNYYLIILDVVNTVAEGIERHFYEI